MKILLSILDIFFPKKKHVHGFEIKDVMNTKKDPMCSCGKTLSQLSK